MREPLHYGANCLASKSVFASVSDLKADWFPPVLSKYRSRQECIPVGCVLPAAVAIQRGSLPGTPRDQAPPWNQAPHAPGIPQYRNPARNRCIPRTRQPPVDRHTPVNILPCPKLRLRAVKIMTTKC